MYPLEIAVNQILPWGSATNPWGPEPGVLSGNSLNFPVAGSSRPSLFAICPVYQSEPSGATAGSWGRESGVGTSNSLIVTLGDAAIRAVLIATQINGPASRALGTRMGSPPLRAVFTLR